jgi:hypothetical protein
MFLQFPFQTIVELAPNDYVEVYGQDLMEAAKCTYGFIKSYCKIKKKDIRFEL